MSRKLFPWLRGKAKNPRWQIKIDDETGYNQAALQLIEYDMVVAWLMLDEEQLYKLGESALQMSTSLRRKRMGFE